MYSISEKSYMINDNRIMKILKLRWRLILFLAAVTALVLLLYHTVRYKYDCNGPYWEESSLKHLNFYCNPLSEPVQGKEGEIDKDVYNLESVHTLIRHGDRYTMFSLPNYQNVPVSCVISDDLKSRIPGLASYQKQMEDLSAQGLRKSDQTFHGYSLYPATETCKTAQLTPEGVAQHLKNGQFLREAYLEKWKLLDETVKWDQILVRCTRKSRTFQSALALMNGFVNDLDLNRMKLEMALNNTMCHENTGHQCSCPASDEFIDVFSCNYLQLSPHVMAMPKMHDAYSQISKLLGVATNSLPRPSHILDVNMIHFCHHAPLPNRYNSCMQPSSMSNIYDAINQNGIDQHNNANMVKIVRLKLQPLMYEIAHRMKNQLNGKSTLKFVLYSGHDSTIEPFANAMGFSTGTWSRYASRIVLELYKKKQDNSGHIRVLYDGKVVTGDVSFCRGRLSNKINGLCSSQHFINFVDGDNMKSLKVESYDKACQIPIL